MKEIKFLAFFVFSFSIIYPQTVSDYPFTGVHGSASVGTMSVAKGGSHSLYHNPATLVEISDHILNVGSAEVFSVPYTHIGWINSINGIGVIGLSSEFSKVSYNNIELSKEQRTGISHGFYLQKDRNSSLAIGTTLNYFSLTLGSSAGTMGDGTDGILGGTSKSWGMDIGIIGILRDKHRIGAYYKNAISSSIGSGGTEQNLPKRLSAGIAYNPFEGLVTSFVFERLSGKIMQLKGSVNFKINSSISSIIGVQSNPNRLGAGIFFSFSRINIGYALLTHPVLPVVHQTGITYKFKEL